MNSAFFSGIVAGKLDTFGDDDGEESDEVLLCEREWRDSELGGFGDVGGRLTRLLPKTASGQGRLRCFRFHGGAGGRGMISSTNYNTSYD